MKKLRQLKNIKLRETEKRELFRRIHNSIRSLPGQAGADLRYPVESPFYKHMFFVHPALMKTGVIAVLVLLVSSSTAFASLSSLPGDLLYGVKINVVEKVAGFTARTPERRAEIEAVHLEKRIREFEALAETGQLTPEASKDLEESIGEKLKDFDESVKAVEESGRLEAKEKIEDALELKIEKHKERIIEIIEDKDKDQREGAVEAVQAVIDRATGNETEGELEGIIEDGEIENPENNDDEAEDVRDGESGSKNKHGREGDNGEIEDGETAVELPAL